MSHPSLCCCGATCYFSKAVAPPNPPHFLSELPLEILQEIFQKIFTQLGSLAACRQVDRYLNNQIDRYLNHQMIHLLQIGQLDATHQQVRKMFEAHCLQERLCTIKKFPPHSQQIDNNALRGCLAMLDEKVVCLAVRKDVPLTKGGDSCFKMIDPKSFRTDWCMIDHREERAASPPLNPFTNLTILKTGDCKGLIYIGCSDGSARLLDPKTQAHEIIAKPTVLRNEGVTVMTSLREYVVACFTDNTVRMWSPRQPEVIRATVPSPKRPDTADQWVSAAPLCTGSVAFGSRQGWVMIWRPSADKVFESRPTTPYIDQKLRMRPLMKIETLGQRIFIAFRHGPIEILDSAKKPKTRTTSLIQLKRSAKLHDFIILKGLLFCLSETREQFSVQIFSPDAAAPLAVLPTTYTPGRLGDYGLLTAQRNTLVLADPRGNLVRWDLDPLPGENDPDAPKERVCAVS